MARTPYARSRRLRAIPLGLWVGLAFGVAGPATGSGVLEINAACVATGCFNGDGAGYPVTIDGSAGRSYGLTGDLVAADPNTHVIEVSTHDVGIDLGGFSIITTACVGATTSACRPAFAFGAGVSTTALGTSVSNGGIVGMGFGVSLGAQSEVTDLRARWNALGGISVGDASRVTGSAVVGNGSNGILTGTGSILSGNTAYQNPSNGISAGGGSTITENSAYENGTGISGGVGSTVAGNTAADNATGILASLDCLVHQNTLRDNTSTGLSLSAGAAYRGNVITTTTTGTASTVIGGVDLDANTCNGAPTCP